MRCRSERHGWTMRRPAPLPVHLRARPFRVAASGVTARRLRASDLTAPIWGIRTTASADQSLYQLCCAWSLRMPPRSFFCGVTAAALQQIPLPGRLRADTAIHLGVPAGERRVDAVGISAHHLTVGNDDLRIRAGLRLTTPERTWCDLAAVLTLAELVAAGDSLLWWRQPVTTLERLVESVERYPGRRGIRNLRLAVTLLTDRSDSPPESEIRIAILAAGLPAPAINEPTTDARGRLVAQTDLSWPQYRTALEYEGDHHRIDKKQWFEDIRRVNDLQAIAWTVIRAVAQDYREPSALVDRLRRSLIRGGWDGKPIRHW